MTYRAIPSRVTPTAPLHSWLVCLRFRFLRVSSTRVLAFLPLDVQTIRVGTNLLDHPSLIPQFNHLRVILDVKVIEIFGHKCL